MPTLYIDFENGNDNHGGTSFSLLSSGSDGRISSTTFSSSTANFANDGSLINQYLSIFNGTIYAIYRITAWVSSTSLTIAAITGGTALANQSVDRQYFIGGRWKTINSGATAVRTIPGDTIRVMGSSTPTSLGINGTWTSGRLSGLVLISSSTNASPISITTNGSHGYSTGDTVVIIGHTINTNANGTWEITVTGSTTFTLNGSTGNGVGAATGNIRQRNNTVVRLASALTVNIASTGNRGEGRTAWTQAANVTATLNTADQKDGDVCDSIAIATAFSTGKAAHKATGTLNLSGYQQISFWIKQTAGTVAVAGDISLRLCTDTNGDTVAHTFNIEGLATLSAWTPITIDLGTNMNSSIQSIALYVDTDRGAQTFLLSNIIACKASSSPDSLTLQSLIGKNTSGETWWAIQSINGTRVFLDAYPSYSPQNTENFSNNRGYYGVSETVITHKRETIKTTLATQAGSVISNINDSGTVGSPINYEFGWDRTNMSTQDSETWLDGRNGNGWGISLITVSYVNINRVSLIRYFIGFHLVTGTNNITVNKSSSVSFNSTGINLNHNANNTVFTNNNFYVDWMIGNVWGIYGQTNVFFNNLYNCKIYSNVQFGVYFNSLNQGQLSECTVSGCTVANCNRSFYLNGTNNSVIENCTASDNSNGLELWAAFNNTFKSFTVSNNVSGISIMSSSANNKFLNSNISGTLSNQSILYHYGYDNYFYNSVMSDSTEFVGGFNSSVLGNGRLYSHNHDNTPGNHIIFTDYGQIQSNNSVRYTNSGLSWALSPTNTARSATYPLDFEIAKVAVAANSLVTIKAWMRRTNTALTTGLRVKGGQIAGVTNDITSYMTAAANTWEQVTLTFTPTEVGVVEVLAECYGGTTHTAYVDNISVTQA